MAHSNELLTTPIQIAEINDFGAGNNLLFSPNGEQFACSNSVGEIGIWETNTGKPIARMKHADHIEALTYNHNGALLASGCYYGDHTARAWDTATGKQLARLEHADTVQALSFSPDGKQLATGGDEQAIHIWDTKTWSRKKSLKLANNLATLSYHPQKNLLIAGCIDGKIFLWDTDTGKVIKELDNQTAFNFLVISPDGSLIASKEFMGMVNIWDTDTWEKVAEIYESTISLAGQAMEFNPDGTNLALGYGEFETYGGVRIYDTQSGQLINNIYRSKAVGALAYSPDGQWLAAGGGDYIAGSRAPSKAWIFKAATGEQLAWVQCHGTIWNIAFSPNSKQITTRDDHSIQIWQLFP